MDYGKCKRCNRKLKMRIICKNKKHAVATSCESPDCRNYFILIEKLSEDFETEHGARKLMRKMKKEHYSNLQK